MIICSATVARDGTIRFPSMNVRWLGYAPGDIVNIQIPKSYSTPSRMGEKNGFLLVRGSLSGLFSGYVTAGENVCIPRSLLADAGIPLGTPFFLVSGDGALAVVAHESDSLSAAEEVAELFLDFGIDVNDPVLIEPKT